MRWTDLRGAGHSTRNDAQGDGVAFSINYLLEEIVDEVPESPGSLPPPTQPPAESTPTTGLDSSGNSPPMAPQGTGEPGVGTSERSGTTGATGDGTPASSTPAPQAHDHDIAPADSDDRLGLWPFFLLPLLAGLILLAFWPRRFIVFTESPDGATPVTGRTFSIQAQSRNGRPLTFRRDVELLLSTSSATGAFAVGHGPSASSRDVPVVLPAGQESVAFSYVDAAVATHTLTARRKGSLRWKTGSHEIVA